MDYICPECQNIYDTQAEADTCAERDREAVELDIAFGTGEARDDSEDYTYSDPRWDHWTGGER